MFSFICIWINDWVNNREAGDLRCYHAHYDVIVRTLIFHLLHNVCIIVLHYPLKKTSQYYGCNWTIHIVMSASCYDQAVLGDFYLQYFQNIKNIYLPIWTYHQHSSWTQQNYERINCYHYFCSNNGYVTERKQFFYWELTVLLIPGFYWSLYCTISCIQCGHNEMYNNNCVSFNKFRSQCTCFTEEKCWAWVNRNNFTMLNSNKYIILISKEKW